MILLFACASGDGPKGVDSPTGDSGDSAETGDSEDTRTLPGVWRLGPPAPSLGLNSVAAHPDVAAIYVANRDVPWVTVVDPETGAWAEALSMAEAGADVAFDPVLAIHGDTLYASAFDRDLLLRWTISTHAAEAPVPLPAVGRAMEAADDGVWVALDDGRVVRFVGDTIVEELTLPMPADALSVDTSSAAWLSREAGTVGRMGRDGVPLFETTVDATWLHDVQLGGDTVYVSDRVSGDVVAVDTTGQRARVHVGSDATTLAWDGAGPLVVSRQGAALSANGAYLGDPGLVTALDAALGVRWTQEVDRLPVGLAWDGAAWWTAGDGSLRMTALAADGAAYVRGAPIGLSLDGLTWSGASLLLTSHLTDTVWALEGDAATAIETCASPRAAVVDPDGVMWVPCVMTGELWARSPNGTVLVKSAGDPFQAPCDTDGICVDGGWVLDATWHADQLWWSDPATRSVRAADGTLLPVETSGDTTRAQQATLRAGASLYVFDPNDQRVVDVFVGTSFDVTTPTADVPLVGENPLFVGSHILDVALHPLATLPGTVVAAGAFVYVLDGDALLVVDGTTELTRMSLHDLRVPPVIGADGSLGPLRFTVGPDEALWIVNVARGTVERRDAETLDALGGDEVLPVGAWSTLDGLR